MFGRPVNRYAEWMIDVGLVCLANQCDMGCKSIFLDFEWCIEDRTPQRISKEKKFIRKRWCVCVKDLVLFPVAQLIQLESEFPSGNVVHDLFQDCDVCCCNIPKEEQGQMDLLCGDDAPSTLFLRHPGMGCQLILDGSAGHQREKNAYGVRLF